MHVQVRLLYLIHNPTKQIMISRRDWIKDLSAFFSGLCKAGDVWLQDDGTPLFFWDHKWSPICGVSFWDDNVGATAFCNKLGYQSGTVNKIQGHYSVAHLRIGRCREGEPLSECSAGGNYLRNDRERYCNPGQAASITIECDQQRDTYSSCNTSKYKAIIL